MSQTLPNRSLSPALALVTLSLITLAGCSGNGGPPPATEHAFIPGPVVEDTRHQAVQRFTLVVWDPAARTAARQDETTPKPERRGEPKGQRPPKRGGQTERQAMHNEPVPGASELDNHAILLLLEQELDQRHWCLDGYEITQRRPTRNGIALEGQCRQPGNDLAGS